MANIVHSHAWRIGHPYIGFSGEVAERLRQARLATVERILAVADEVDARALLVTGEVFADPSAADAPWRELAELLAARSRLGRTLVFALGSAHSHTVWSSTHPFRARLPRESVVVDAYPATVVLDNARVAVVRGLVESTEAARVVLVPNASALEEARSKGVDYAATVEGTHSWFSDRGRIGTCEPIAFDDPTQGKAVVVRGSGEERIQLRDVASRPWVRRKCTSIADLEAALAPRRGCVEALTLDYRAPLAEFVRSERMLEALLEREEPFTVVERSSVELDVGSIEAAFSMCTDNVQATARRLIDLAQTQPASAHRALVHLYRLVEEARAAGSIAG